MVKQSGGYIRVYSELGRGTTFKIYFPTAKGASVNHAAKLHKISPKASATILLVEDEEAMRRLASSMLVEAGYRVYDAEDGAHALEVARQHRGSIDLLLTDVILPRVSGPELAERLKALQPELKVVYMSGYTDDLIAQHGILKEGLLLLEKPFTRETLLGRIGEVLSAQAAKGATASASGSANSNS